MKFLAIDSRHYSWIKSWTVQQLVVYPTDRAWTPKTETNYTWKRLHRTNCTVEWNHSPTYIRMNKVQILVLLIFLWVKCFVYWTAWPCRLQNKEGAIILSFPLLHIWTLLVFRYTFTVLLSVPHWTSTNILIVKSVDKGIEVWETKVTQVFPHVLWY